LWTSRSRMGVARVWSPKTSPHSSGSSCSSPGRDSPFHTAGREAGKRDWRPPGRGEDSRSRLKSGAWEASASTGGSPAVFRPGPSEAFPEGLRKTKTTPGIPLPRPCPPRKWPGGSFRPRVARGRPRSLPAPQTTVPPPPGKGEKPKTQGSPSVSRDQRGWGGNLKSALSGPYHALDFSNHACRYLSEFPHRFIRRFRLNELPVRLFVIRPTTNSSPERWLRAEDADWR